MITAKPKMTLWALSLFTLLIMPGQLMAQQDIEIVDVSISEQLEPGTSITVDIIISNTGDATLNWSAELSDTYGRGGGVSFSKADFANWLLPVNQDRISDNVWLARGDTKSIFNAKSETTSDNNSPSDTEWALGIFNDASTFDTFKNMHGSDPQSLIGNTATLHNISDDNYYEVDFSAWTGGNAGGGFAYTRFEMFQYLNFTTTNSGAIAAAGQTTLSIEISAEDLASAMYTGSLTVTSDDPDEATIVIPIDLEVLESATFELSATSFSQTMTTDDASVEQTLTISNNGASTLNWTSSETSNRPGGMSGVSLSNYSGTVEPGENQEITITFSASENYEGMYEWPITMYSNDPNSEEVSVIVTLEIIGVPSILIEEYEPVFDDTFVDATTSKTLTVINEGTGTLEVSNIASDASQFVPTKSSLSIAPGESDEIDVLFSPDAVGNFSANLTFSSNDSENASLVTGVSGDGIAAPAISVSPLSYSETISTSDNPSKTVTVNNSGAGELEWTININAGAIEPNGTSFEKEDYADPSLEANQDRITSTVWLTRGSSQPLFNYFEETSWSESTATIKWAPSATADASPEDYTSLSDALNGNIGNEIQSTTMSLHLLDEDRYFDLEFHTWTRNSNGGGFSYTRKEVKQWLNVDETIIEGDANITSSSASTMFDLDIDGLVMYEGDFVGKATISSNDPLEAVQIITVNVSVSGTPDITATASTASTSAVVGGSQTIEIPIENAGDGFLTVSNIVSDNAVLVPSETSFTIAPFETHLLEATFSPQAVQIYDIDLTISSDDPVSSSYVIDVTAEGLEAPSISFSAITFSATLGAGNSTTQSLTISNNGLGDLDWDVGEVYFEKANGADFTLAENQDRIYDDVWITRRDYEPIFNYFETTDYNSNSETIMYGDGATGSLSFSDYSPDFQDATSECGSCLEGNVLSLYLVDYDEYYDLEIDFWQSNEQGGGFSYLRRLASPWLSLDTYNDNLGTEGSSEVGVTFDASNLYAGNYEFEYEIQSNDPANPATTVTFMLEVTGIPGLSIDEGSVLNFNDQFVGTAGTGSLIVRNTGTATLDISNIQFDDAAFSVSATTATVEPGASVTLDLSFEPSAEQAYSATGTITSNDPDVTSTFSVSGTGIAIPDVSIDVSSFDVELISGGLIEKSFTITNNGSNSVNWEIDKIILSGSSEVLFEKEDYADWTLEVNQDRITDNIWITRANERGLFNIAQETSYTNGSRDRIAIEIEIPEENDASPLGTLWSNNATYDQSEESNYDSWRDAADGSPDNLPGNTLSMLVTDEDRYFDVEFLSWTAGECCGNPNGGGFAYRRYETVSWMKNFSSTGGAIDAEATEDVNFKVDADGIDAGEYTATIVISDGLNTYDIDVSLTVLGLPEISVEEEAIDFETVFIGDAETKEFAIENNGFASLNISSITSDETAFTVSEVSSVGSDESVIIEVTFIPTDAVNYSGILTILSDDPANPSITINLSGSGSNPPALNVDKTSLDQTLFFGASASQTFTISNTGDADLEWNLGVSGGTVEFSKADWADFTLAENQDRITDDVWITRGDSKGIFNIAQEEEYSNSNNSPVGTLWGYGATGEVGEGGGECCFEIARAALVIDIGEAFYSDWRDVVGGSPSPDNIYSMYLPDHDLYYDVMFTSWTEGNEDGVPPGGGFSYSRTPIFYEYDAISFSQTEGVITPGQSQVVTVFFNPTGTFDGKFELDLQVESNDPTGPAEIPLSLNVNGIIVETPIEDQLINEGFSSTNIDISGLFIDAQDDPLNYTIESSNGAVASAVESGESLTVTEVGTGTTTLSITAEDGKGSSDLFEFDFRINAIPVVSAGIADQSYENSFGSDAFDMSAVFSDADAGDELSYSVSTSAAGVVDAAVASGILTVTEMGPGTVDVTVTANDGFGGEISDVFEVFVNKINQTITFGALSTVSEDVGSISLTATASSGLTVSYQSSNTSVATVSGSLLNILSDGQTTITASQVGDAAYNAATAITQTLVVEAVLGAGDLESIEVYPNPVDDFLTVANEAAAKIEIYHLDGKLVLTQEISEKANLSELEQGVYLIKLKDKDDAEIYTGRLVKK
ncbi:choice-of-anchor D domain-containing protein [Ekhidna sp.]|uniref:choice-of-anchor D domain-containing protein n=1 Tax=Ekhidna sp. TaxID=2608089 RepID=UPI00329793F1